MDKQTLSGYGWIVIVTLVLAVLLALATPFGTYVGDGVVTTVNGLINTSSETIKEENIETMSDKWENKFSTFDKTENVSSNNTVTYTSLGNYRHQLSDGTIENHNTESGICALCGENVLAPGYYDLSLNTMDFGEYGPTYYYTDNFILVLDLEKTKINESEYTNHFRMTKVLIPNSVKTFDAYAFCEYADLKDIIYDGSQQEWNNILKGDDWNYSCSGGSDITVHCLDGDIIIPANN